MGRVLGFCGAQMKKEQAVLERVVPTSSRVNGHGDQTEALERSIGAEQRQARQRLTLLKTAWRSWLRFAEVLGTIQMTVILSLTYWIMVPIMAVPFKLLADPLAMRKPGQARWIIRDSGSPTLDEMKQQY